MNVCNFGCYSNMNKNDQIKDSLKSRDLKPYVDSCIVPPCSLWKADLGLYDRVKECVLLSEGSGCIWWAFQSRIC